MDRTRSYIRLTGDDELLEVLQGLHGAAIGDEHPTLPVVEDGPEVVLEAVEERGAVRLGLEAECLQTLGHHGLFDISISNETLARLSNSWIKKIVSFI